MVQDFKERIKSIPLLKSKLREISKELKIKSLKLINLKQRML